MIALLQRVSSASVTVAGTRVASIGNGLLVLAGVERGDGNGHAERLGERILSYRLFADEEGKMNRSVIEVGGAVLLVPQFTLAADTSRGNRASFSTAAAPEEGRRLFEHLVARARTLYAQVFTGVFGAQMQVALVNEGPVTFWLQVR